MKELRINLILKAENDDFYQLLIKVLTRTGFEYNYVNKFMASKQQPGLRIAVAYTIREILDRYILRQRKIGRDWPSEAETMVGILRLENVLTLMKKVKNNKIEGDLVECGVWRGGVLILMARFIMLENMDKIVYGYDSFKGLPKPDMNYPEDSKDIHHTHENLVVSKKDVIRNLEKYEVDLNLVNLVEGWFNQTTLSIKPEKIAILRLDGDMFESTWTCLENLYPNVCSGGYVIIDDYNIPQCRKAVDKFIDQYDLKIELIKIDSNGVYFQKPF